MRYAVKDQKGEEEISSLSLLFLSQRQASEIKREGSREVSKQVAAVRLVRMRREGKEEGGKKLSGVEDEGKVGVVGA